MDIVDRLYNEMLEQMKKEKQKKITTLIHAKRMVDSGFTEMITQDEFKTIVDYINTNNTYRNTTVKHLDGTKLEGKKWVNFTGDMLKFGDTLVSLIRHSKTVYKNGTSYEILGSIEFVIGKNFDPSYTVKISSMSKNECSMPINEFDEKENIEPVDIEALISKIEESYPRRHEGFTLYKTGENPNEEGQTRISEEKNIEQISQEIPGLSDTATSLSAELQKTRAELAKTEEATKSQASDKLEETKV